MKREAEEAEALEASGGVVLDEEKKRKAEEAA